MDRMLIISQQHEQENDAIRAGVLLANQLALSPEVTSYSYESFAGDAYYNPRIAAAARLQLLSEAENNIQTELMKIGAEHVPYTAIWCKNMSEHACQQVNADEYGMIFKTLPKAAQFKPEDWQLIRHTPIPLMLLSNNLLNQAKSILMAVDLDSSNSEKQRLNQAVINQAMSLAKATGAELHLGFVIQLPKVLRDMDILDTHYLVKESYQRHQQQLAELGLAPDNIHILVGDTDLCLFELSCRLKAQYLVMGIRQQKGILGRLIGNTAESILLRLRSSILIVPDITLTEEETLTNLL